MTTPTISQLLSRLHNAVNVGDEDAIKACYGNDANIVSAPLHTDVERDCVHALRRFQQRFMPSHIVTTGDEVVLEAGDIALVIAKLYLVPRSTPHALPCEGKRAVYVMQKQENEQWRCIIDNFFGTDLLDFA